MNTWLAQVARFKPDFLPGWLFWILLLMAASFAAVIGAAGLWVLFTQVEFL